MFYIKLVFFSSALFFISGCSTFSKSVRKPSSADFLCAHDDTAPPVKVEQIIHYNYEDDGGGDITITIIAEDRESGIWGLEYYDLYSKEESRKILTTEGKTEQSTNLPRILPRPTRPISPDLPQNHTFNFFFKYSEKGKKANFRYHIIDGCFNIGRDYMLPLRGI